MIPDARVALLLNDLRIWHDQVVRAVENEATLKQEFDAAVSGRAEELIGRVLMVSEPHAQKLEETVKRFTGQLNRRVFTMPGGRLHHVPTPSVPTDDLLTNLRRLATDVRSQIAGTVIALEMLMPPTANGILTSKFALWPFFSAVCGIGAVVLAIIIWLLPTNEWRAIVGGLIGLGLLVTAFVMSMNPVNFYRRMLSYVIPSGMLVNALGFSFDAFVSHETTKGSFRWDSSVSGWFFAAWAAVIGFLVWGDLKQRR